MRYKKSFCDVSVGMILSETKAKGMLKFSLKRVESDLSMLSYHLYEPLKLFHSLLLANQPFPKQVSN